MKLGLCKALRKILILAGEASKLIVNIVYIGANPENHTTTRKGKYSSVKSVIHGGQLKCCVVRV
jgi:hypothetical protein